MVFNLRLRRGVDVAVHDAVSIETIFLGTPLIEITNSITLLVLQSYFKAYALPGEGLGTNLCPTDFGCISRLHKVEQFIHPADA